jgi:hypothetical protein
MKFVVAYALKPYADLKLAFLVTGSNLAHSSLTPEQCGGLIMQVFVAFLEHGAAASHEIPGCDSNSKRLCNQDSCLPPCGKVWMFLQD